MKMDLVGKRPNTIRIRLSFIHYPAFSTFSMDFFQIFIHCPTFSTLWQIWLLKLVNHISFIEKKNPKKHPTQVKTTIFFIQSIQIKAQWRTLAGFSKILKLVDHMSFIGKNIPKTSNSGPQEFHPKCPIQGTHWQG